MEQTLFRCPDDECERQFLTEKACADHAEAVHTFNEIRQMLQATVRAKVGVGTGSRRRWVYIEDVADDWLVYVVETDSPSAGGDGLYKASYSIVDNKVTLGDPVQVVRRTVYVPMSSDDAAKSEGGSDALCQ